MAKTLSDEAEPAMILYSCGSPGVMVRSARGLRFDKLALCWESHYSI